MKKIMMFLAATFLMFGLSGQAMAYFVSGDLVQVVYSSADNYEVATDLGAFAPTTAYTGPTITLNTNPFPAAGTTVFSNSGWSNMQVSYFVYGGTSAAWTSGPAAGQLSAGPIGFQSASPAQTVLGLYANPTSAQVAVLKSNLSSYFSNMDNGGSTLGTFAGFIPAGNGEQNLAALAQGGPGYVDQYLYYYSNPGTAAAGLQVADIRTFTNGTTEILPVNSTVPVPPSALLMGSGLISLLGIRRKQ